MTHVVIVLLIVLIIIVAAGVFFLLFSATYASFARLMESSKAGSDIVTAKKHRTRILLFRALGAALLILALLGVCVMRYQNGLRYDTLLYTETAITSEFTDSDHTSFYYNGELFVKCEDQDLDYAMRDCILGEAVLNVRDTANLGRLSDLGCRILNIQPYETMYAVSSECPAELYFGGRDGYYYPKQELQIVEDFFQLND